MDDIDWTTEDRLWCLVDGALAFEVPGEPPTQLVATPDGEYVSIRLGPIGWRGLSAVLDRQVTPAVGVAALAEPEPREIAGVLDVLAAESLLVLADDGRTVGPPAGQVVVVGTTLVAIHLVQLLTAEGCQARMADRLDPLDLPSQAAVIVACADWLPDAAWQALDEACRQAALPWHRCWREGRSAWLGPFTLPHRSASYRDLRLRRLAAAEWPDELAATWARLTEAPPTAPPWDPALAAVLAGSLTADVMAYLRAGRSTPALAVGDPAFAWRGLTIADRRWHEHPVLPLPDGVLVDAR